MVAILEGYKNSIPADQWLAFLTSLPQDLQKRLQERYPSVMP